jgi:hypothetical protein
MALDAACGTFTTSTGTSNRSVTGLSFQPKVVLFFGGPFTAAATGSAHANMCIGWATSSTQRGCVYFNDEDAVGTTDASSIVRTDSCYGLRLTDDSGVDGLLDFVSMNADGFTVVPDDAFASDFLVGYLALGGSTLTNQIAGSWTAPSTSGTFDITDAGFQPDSLLLLCGGRGNSTLNSQGSTNPFGLAFGATDGTLSRCIGYYANDGSTAETCGAIIRSDSIMNALADGSNTNRYTFDSFLSNGFRLNKQDGTTAHVGLYLALAGASVKLSDIENQASTGNFSISGVGFKPSAALFTGLRGSIDGSGNPVFQTAQQADNQTSFGAATDASSRAAVNVSSDDAADPTDTASSFSTTRCYVQHNIASPHALGHSWDFVSFDTDGYTLNQTDANGARHQGFGLAFGPAASGGGGSSTIIMRRRRGG